VSIKPKLGLRGRLAILITLAVVALSALLTFYTSNYLASTINHEYMHRAEALAGFMEAGMIGADGRIQTEHCQSEIDNLARTNSEVKKISVYSYSGALGLSPSSTSGTVIASSDRTAIGKPAESNDIMPIATNKTTFVEDQENGTEEGGPDNESDVTENTVEMLAPLHNIDGLPIASVGIYLDTGPRDGLIRTQQIRYAIFTNVGLLALLIAVSVFINHLLIRPLRGITSATRQIGRSGGYEPPAALNRHDELGDLARAFDELAGSLEVRDEEVKLLLEASIAVSSALRVDKILEILCDKIAESKKVTYCRISMLDPDTDSLVIRAAAPARNIAGWKYGIGDSIDLGKASHHAQVLKTGKAAIIRKNGQIPANETVEEWEWSLSADTTSALLLPLAAKDEVLGIVTLGEVRSWARTPFSDKKIEFYQTLLNHAAVAIDNAELYEKTERHFDELSAMHKISQAFTASLDYQEVVSVVAKRLGSLIGAQFASVLLPDGDGRHLNIVASYNLSAEYVWTINKKNRIPAAGGPIGSAFANQTPKVINNVLEDDDYAPWKHLARIQGYSSLVALPLMAKGQAIGVICIYFAEPFDPNEQDMGLLTTAANEAAIAIENARVHENLQDAFVGTIRSLAETIDAKDAYTMGHSERVSLYSEAIARGLGLDGNELQTIRYAGYLHDVGKIGIPDVILAKPGKLTVDEFRVIQNHPVLSEKILKPVNFPFPVQSIVRHHHERYDGKGYPDGLAGEEIPLGARILFVADAYEAMTSDRPYRKALSPAMALDELERNKVTQFDARIVDVFSRIVMSDKKSIRGEEREPDHAKHV